LRGSSMWVATRWRPSPSVPMSCTSCASGLLPVSASCSSYYTLVSCLVIFVLWKMGGEGVGTGQLVV
jgi:hypothetical protein